jgi:hypothetical protein
MKYLLNASIALVFCLNVVSQELNLTTNQDRFFIQIILEVENDSIYSEIESGLRTNPYVFMVRLDKITNGLFIVTEGVNQINRNIVNGWLGEHDSSIRCYRQGIHGVHEVLPFDNNFCDLVEE